MIGSGLKKMAKENGMQVAKGVAYGSLHGYAATLSEGQGWKQIVFTTVLPEEGGANLQNLLQQRDLKKEFRVQNIEIAEKYVRVVFFDNPGTMKLIYAFVDWFIPLLGRCGASGVAVCTQCGMEISGGSWKLINGAAYHLHDGCAEQIRRQLEEQQQEKLAAGSYARGALGAFGGAVLGAIVWAVVLLMGYIAAVAGFVVGFLANKGYDLMHGKQGKGKIVILVASMVFGVLLGTVGADAVSLAQMILAGELPGIGFAQIPELIFWIFVEEADYRAATLGNIGVGVLFAALGAWMLVYRAGKDVAGQKIVDLK